MESNNGIDTGIAVDPAHASQVTSGSRLKAIPQASLNGNTIQCTDESIAHSQPSNDDCAHLRLNPEGNIITWDLGAQKTIGYEALEIIGHHMRVLYTADDAQSGMPARELDAATIHGRAVCERWSVRKDGTRFWSESATTAQYGEDGKPAEFSGHLRALTVQPIPQSMEGLRPSPPAPSQAIEEQYAIITVDNAGNFASWSASVERMLGYSETEFIGKSSAILFTREDITAGKADEERRRAQTSAQTHYECWHVRKDGTRFWATCILIAPSHTMSGNSEFLKVIHDNTEHRNSQAALKKAKDDLEQSVIERTLELSQAVDLLEKQLTEREQLEAALLDASETERERLGQDLHDGVCQQLTGTALLARLLGTSLARREAPETEQAQCIVDMIRAAVDQARDLAKGLHPVSIHSSKGLVAALEELASRASSTLECLLICPARLDIAPPTALHLYRLAQEAVRNAIKHAHASRIIITVHAKPDEPFELSITDNGIGITIDPENHRGMGLMNLQYRARAIGAELALESTPGAGTVVRCTFAASADATCLAGAIPAPAHQVVTAISGLCSAL